MEERQKLLDRLVEHFESPRNKGALEDVDVVMPGGSPECGGFVTVYLKGSEEDGRIDGLSFTGEGDTISQGAASILMQRVHDEGLTMGQVMDLDYDEFVDGLGRQVIGIRTRNATLALGTLKSAIRKYRQGNSISQEAAAQETAPSP